jgi:hypothetical protein
VSCKSSLPSDLLCCLRVKRVEYFLSQLSGDFLADPQITLSILLLHKLTIGLILNSWTTFWNNSRWRKVMCGCSFCLEMFSILMGRINYSHCVIKWNPKKTWRLSLSFLIEGYLITTACKFTTVKHPDLLWLTLISSKITFFILPTLQCINYTTIHYTHF